MDHFAIFFVQSHIRFVCGGNCSIYVSDFSTYGTPAFQYPLWPPRIVVDAIHWYGSNFDPLILINDPWWLTLIWFDVLVFGPFYIFAIWAFIKGKEWIRGPSLIYAGMMIVDVIVILSEEFFGIHAAPNPWIPFIANFCWLLGPILVIIRFSTKDHPFTEEINDTKNANQV